MEPDDYDYDSSPPSNPAQPTKHTQFLDLTNGEGGDGGLLENVYDGDDEYPDHSDITSTKRGTPLTSLATVDGSGSSVILTGSAGEKIDPNTPGRVVDTGSEHTGRWTKEEHEAFLSALHTYGKEWKKVAAKVKTRTVVQTRTHAQKYFQKLSKSMDGSGDEVSYSDMGLALESGKRTGSTQKKKPRPLPPAQKVQRTASVASAAQVISNLSGPTSAPPVHPMAETSPSSSTTSSKAHGFRTGLSSIDGFTMSSVLAAASSPEVSLLQQPTHGFRSAFQSMTEASMAEFQSSSAASLGHITSAATAGVPQTSRGFLSTTGASAIGTSSFPSTMKIVAPEPDSATNRGKFPEPSPAACGKRKLAEIAAARMLAGVLASEPRTLSVPSIGSRSFSAAIGHDTSVVDHDMHHLDSIEDGTATPPPEEVKTPRSGAAMMMVEMSNIPAPQSATSSGSGAAMMVSAPTAVPPKKTFGLSLQIVNPESLGVSHEQIEKRRRDGQGSPVTPWEGQLQALVSEERRRGPAAPTLELPQAPSMEAISMPSSSPLHPVVGPSSGFGRSLLHKFVCDMDIGAIQSHMSGDYFERRDQKGYCPIHTACALCLKDPNASSVASEIVRMLINAGADASIRDLDGNTPLHWAARAGDKATAELLLVKNNPKDAKNERGETPLHWAMRAGRRGIPVTSVLVENGARPSVWSMAFKRPIDIAGDGFADEPNSVMEIRSLVDKRKKLTKEQRQRVREAAEERKESRANLFECSPQSRSLILYHPECLEHIPKAESDWENPERVSSILEKLTGQHLKPGTPSIHPNEIQISKEFEKAKLDLLSRVHSTEYLSFVNELSKDLERQHKAQNGNDTGENDSKAVTPPVVPFTPMVQRSMIKVQESSVKLGQHSDTSFSAGSLRAARRAAGAVQHAVDCVLVGRQRNAFCIVRPPGHHAGINGLLDGGESCGFCIFNSVAAGAMHAISDERLMCERCAIVDIDVHHGNGTEEIVRKCHDPGKLFFFSIHLYDNDRKGKRETKSFQYKFYPGTGDEDDLPLNIINVPITPLWKDKDPPTVSASHNTRHRTRNRAPQSDDGDSSEAETPRASDAEVESRISSGTSSPTTTNPGVSSGRLAYRRNIQNRLLPALRAFNPDLILISAGFDACKGDVGNAKHESGGKEKVGIDLEPEDYAWTTRKVLEIADICCQGRVVSVLEGGYGRHPATGVYDPTKPLDKSLFSECAMRHVHAMIDPYNVEARFGSNRKADA